MKVNDMEGQYMVDHEILVDVSFPRIWLREAAGGVWTEIALGGADVSFVRGDGCAPSSAAAVLPSATLIRTGLVPPERLSRAEERQGTYPRDYIGDLYRKYFLFFSVEERALFLLQQDVPAVPSRIRGANILMARYLDRLGRRFCLVNGELETREGTLLVPRREALVPISLELLLGAGLTSEEIVISVGGTCVFTPNPRFRPEDW